MHFAIAVVILCGVARLTFRKAATHRFKHKGLILNKRITCTRNAGVALAAAIAIVAGSSPSSAQSVAGDGNDYEAVVPVVAGWYNGKVALYLSTDSSQRDVSRLTHTNFVGRLSGAIAGGAVDDIYQLTNYKQGNIIPSAPIPAGPGNMNPAYTPLWQLSLVSWIGGTPHTLRSEAEVLAEKSAGHVRIVKTSIVINCPVIFTPAGGTLYGIHIRH